MKEASGPRPGFFDQLPMYVPIFGSHVARIGLWRTVAASFLMYLTIPIFVFLHLTVGVFLLQFFMRLLHGTERLRVRDYIILDRHKVHGLHAIDKFNCLFCGYANGTIQLMHAKLDQLHHAKTSLTLPARCLQSLFFVPHAVFFSLAYIWATIAYLALARVQGLHRPSLRIVNRAIEDAGWFRHMRGVTPRILRFYKHFACLMSFSLGQIESAWCPLKHLDRQGSFVPDHHDQFLGRDQVEQLTAVLRWVGSVSELPPRTIAGS